MKDWSTIQKNWGSEVTFLNPRAHFVDHSFAVNPKDYGIF